MMITLFLDFSLSHRHTLSPSLFSLFFTYTSSLYTSHFLLCPYTHTHYLSHKQSPLTSSLSLKHTLSLSHTLSHTQTVSLSHTFALSTSHFFIIFFLSRSIYLSIYVQTLHPCVQCSNLHNLKSYNIHCVVDKSERLCMNGQGPGSSHVCLNKITFNLSLSLTHKRTHFLSLSHDISLFTILFYFIIYR